MNNIIHLNHKNVKVMKLVDIPVGTFFRCDALSSVLGIGTPNTYVNRMLLFRTYDNVVSMDTPTDTWDNLDNLLATGYAPVEVTIKEERYL